MNAQRLLALQQIDTGLDRLAHRKRTLPELAALTSARAAQAAWQQQGDAAAAQAAACESLIAQSEAESVALTTKRQRLEQQLKTVIAPREAEALMHEIEMINSRRNELDDHELEALTTLSDTEKLQKELTAAEPGILADVRAAADALASAEGQIATDLAQLGASRETTVAEIPPADLAQYEALRKQFGGVAISTLNGRACTGCHLDLSAAEYETVKLAPADELPQCPQCGRLIAR